jgi:hypothetical protein
MDYRPFENTLEAILDPKFLDQISGNFNILDPSFYQQAAMGRRFRTNSRIYRYGRLVGADAPSPNTTMLMDFVTFEVTTAAAGNAYNCISLRPMATGQYGTFCMVFPYEGSGGGPGTSDYNALTNKPIYNLTANDVTAAYTTAPVTYVLGDKARVIGTNTIDTVNYAVYSECLYVEIDNTTPVVARALPAYARMYLDTRDVSSNTNPLTDTSPYIDGRDLQIEGYVTRSYDCRLLNAVPSNTKRFGWVWMHSYDGPISDRVDVDPPEDVLPNVGLNRRKNARIKT